jgi:hypothetical protein
MQRSLYDGGACQLPTVLQSFCAYTALQCQTSSAAMTLTGVNNTSIKSMVILDGTTATAEHSNTCKCDGARVHLKISWSVDMDRVLQFLRDQQVRVQRQIDFLAHANLLSFADQAETPAHQQRHAIGCGAQC